MMDANLDWTEQLGASFVAQQADVMDTIQRLRQQAAAAGTLWSNAQQRVTEEGQGIAIEPANPAYMYPPVYNPAVVYGPWPLPDYPPLDIVPPDYGPGFALPFGIGFNAGFAVVQPLWRWCAFDWVQRQIRFHVEKINFPERTDSRPEIGHMAARPGASWRRAVSGSRRLERAICGVPSSPDLGGRDPADRDSESCLRIRPWSYRTPPRGHSRLADWAP